MRGHCACITTTSVMGVRFGFVKLGAVVACLAVGAAAGCGTDGGGALKPVGRAGASGSSGSAEGGATGESGSGGGLELGGSSGASGSEGGTDPCLAAQCGAGQRCEAADGGASCVDNTCADLQCTTTEKCE